MSAEESLIRRLYDEGINRRDAVTAAGFYAPDAMNHGRSVGRAGMQRVFEALFSTFPDFHYVILGGLAHDAFSEDLDAQENTHPHPLILPPEGEGRDTALRTVRIDRVVCRVVMTGTHLGRPTMPEIFHGMLSGVEPTGKRVEVLQYHDFRVRDGQIVEHAAVRDDLGMLLQLGLVRRTG